MGVFNLWLTAASGWDGCVLDLINLLELNNRSTAFEGFAVNWEDEATSVTVQHVLTPALPLAVSPRIGSGSSTNPSKL